MMKMRTDYSNLLGKHVKIKLACGTAENEELEGDIIQIVVYREEDAAILYDSSYKTQLVALNKGTKVTVLGEGFVYDCYGGVSEDDHDRIEGLIAKMKEVWELKPDLRMGQLLCELLRLTQSDGYYVSDCRMHTYLDQLRELLIKECK